MIKEPHVPLFDIVMCLSNAMDLVSQTVVDHHKRVAYIALSIATELGLFPEEQSNLLLAGLLHDSGALSLKERLDTLQFELKNPHKHAELGCLLLKRFKPFSKIASLVRYHHVHWSKGSGSQVRRDKVPREAHILHLADRVSVLIDKQKEVLGQVKGICQRIQKNSGKMFVPEFVDVFKSLSTKEYFWLDAASLSISSILARRSRLPITELDMMGLLDLAKLFSQIIDFRSRFTATHSSGVAASAEALARFIGFSERECQMMKIAGYLHDLGKLAVPAEILEKPAKLTKDEFNIIKNHTFYTYRILETISDLEVISTWASFHHERLDGKGYPFHHKGENLSLGSRIMAVADVHTAITEDRPYRKAMNSDKALQIVEERAKNLALDSNIISILTLHQDEVNCIRITAQKIASKEYQDF